ncbi:MAG: metallophosphoesterase [Anaerolineaceae bacterium]
MGFSSQIKKRTSDGFAITLSFVFLDAIFFSALPLLNISYGPILSVLSVFIFIRVGIFFIYFLCSHLFSKSLVNFSRMVKKIPILITNLLITILAVYGFCIEPFLITINRVEIPVSGLKETIRIVQLSDLHIERTTKRERILPGLVNHLEPDLIVITGDFVNESDGLTPEKKIALTKLLNQLQAPMGVFAVNGNIESPWSLRPLLKDTQVQVLDNAIVRLMTDSGKIVMVGLSCLEWQADGMELQKLMNQAEPDEFSILLYHKPDLAYEADKSGVDLYLAGHTHGGQVRLPFYGAIYTNSRYGKTFEMSLYQLSHTTLYVNRGLGFTGGSTPRIRFLAPPEVTLIELVPG